MKKIPDYQIRAINDAVTSENRIHSDAIAQKFGFTGALVSGVSVFGYLTHPLVKTFGEDWLSRSIVEVRFLKPAYANDLLTVKTQLVSGSVEQQHFTTGVYNETGLLLAQMESWQKPQLPPVNAMAAMTPGGDATTREAIRWDLIHLNQPTVVNVYPASIAQQQDGLEIMRDELAIYREGDSPLLHPYLLLKECNQALMRMFLLPAWIHVGSRLVLRQAARVGQALDVMAVPLDKWERKGHQFIKLYVVMKSGTDVVLEVEHSAIFKIADS